MHIISTWESPADDDRHIDWVRGTHAAVRPFGVGGAYLNFTVDEGIDRVRAAYGDEKYKRLVELKQRYDPANFFHVNQNIKPKG